MLLRRAVCARPSRRARAYGTQAEGSSLEISVLHRRYMQKEIGPSAFFAELCDKIEAHKSNNAFIFRPPQAHILGRARELELELNENPRTLFQRRPLFGVPFTVKDNFDVVGYPTTAGCPDFAYTPWATAFAIKKLEDAGAVLVGKCNMDQFATGLVGVRTPYGTPVNPFNAAYCPGGSSSGSGVAVATGLCSFSIGTDTAGSGRVPATLTNTVGLKPTKGLISTHGMVPACRSLDCASIFALSVRDSWKVLNVMKGFDPADEYSVQEPPFWQVEANKPKTRAPRFGIPKGASLAFFGDTHGAQALFQAACDRLLSLTQGTLVEIDFAPFTEVARILYEGPWVAQRLSVIKDFLKHRPDSVLPITKSIISRGDTFSAVDLFLAERRLERLRRTTEQIWRSADVDMLVVPTAGITPTIAEVAEMPLGVNTMLGYYTNFVNLLNLSALAIPAGFLPNGMPAGISLVGQAWQDHALANLGNRFQESMDLKLGATDHRLAPASVYDTPFPSAGDHFVPLAVVGAHLTGMPLNSQLTSLGAVLKSATRTAPRYRLYDISKSASEVSRPGLVHVGAGEGAAFEVEVWNVPADSVGHFMRFVASPLAIGNVELADGSVVKGFVCEGYATKSAQDISQFSGWRQYVASKAAK